MITIFDNGPAILTIIWASIKSLILSSMFNTVYPLFNRMWLAGTWFTYLILMSFIQVFDMVYHLSYYMWFSGIRITYFDTICVSIIKYFKEHIDIVYPILVMCDCLGHGSSVSIL